MEINGIAESLLVAESAASDLDGFDPAVDALGRAVGNLQYDGIENAPKVLFDCFRNLYHGLQAATNGPGSANVAMVSSFSAQARAVFRLLSRKSRNQRH
jgi:hypothetical protein